MSEPWTRPSPPKGLVALRAMVFDEDIDKRLAVAVKMRGFRGARSVEGLLGKGKKDHLLLPALFRQSPPVVLVTFDQAMPYTHNDLLQRFQLPIAIIDSVGDRGPLTEIEYHYDVVHRWAHHIVQLRPGNVLWYQRGGHSLTHSIFALPNRSRRKKAAARGEHVEPDQVLEVARPEPPPGVLF